MTDYPNEGYDGWVAAVADGEGYYLACPADHGSLPPRRVCPECGNPELTEEPLPATGEVATYTVTHVASPGFAEDTPYAVAVVEFGPVAVTGQVRGVDPDDVEVGQVVAIDVDATATTGEALVVFEPR